MSDKFSNNRKGFNGHNGEGKRFNRGGDRGGDRGGRTGRERFRKRAEVLSKYEYGSSLQNEDGKRDLRYDPSTDSYYTAAADRVGGGGGAGDVVNNKEEGNVILTVGAGRLDANYENGYPFERVGAGSSGSGSVNGSGNVNGNGNGNGNGSNSERSGGGVRIDKDVFEKINKEARYRKLRSSDLINKILRDNFSTPSPHPQKAKCPECGHTFTSRPQTQAAGSNANKGKGKGGGAISKITNLVLRAKHRIQAWLAGKNRQQQSNRKLE